jgi:hypothetical protein
MLAGGNACVKVFVGLRDASGRCLQRVRSGASSSEDRAVSERVLESLRQLGRRLTAVGAQVRARSQGRSVPAFVVILRESVIMTMRREVG